MNDFVIFTDSGCDLPLDLLRQWGVELLDLTFHFEGEGKEYAGSDMEPAVFYDRMKAGEVAKTAAVNMDTFKNAFEGTLEQGRDVLYIGFSSGLSATYHSSTLAAEELMEEHPGRRVVTVDTLAASAGQGMLVWLAVETRKNGGTIDEVARAVENHKMNLAHWFTVDDLNHLKRGGRVSAATALVGTMLSIKPVLHVDDEGHLINMSKARGRAASLKALVDKMEEDAIDPAGQTIFISHGDSEADARKVADMVKERFGVEVKVIDYVGPVIGCHAGPGVIALFYLGRKR